MSLTKSTKSDRDDLRDCRAIHGVWNELARAWTLPIIHTLGMGEPARFNELKKKIGGISATSLSERLAELETRGVVKRRVYPETPPRVEYSLTEKGQELQVLLCELADWVVKWEPSNLLVKGSEELQYPSHKNTSTSLK